MAWKREIGLSNEHISVYNCPLKFHLKKKKAGKLECLLLDQFYNKVLNLLKQNIKFKGTYPSFFIFIVTIHG